MRLVHPCGRLSEFLISLPRTHPGHLPPRPPNTPLPPPPGHAPPLGFPFPPPPPPLYPPPPPPPPPGVKRGG
ncbi:hypothetical protein ACISSW_19205, partial [Escherichia coli]